MAKAKLKEWVSKWVTQYGNEILQLKYLTYTIFVQIVGLTPGQYQRHGVTMRTVVKKHRVWAFHNALPANIQAQFPIANQPDWLELLGVAILSHKATSITISPLHLGYASKSSSRPCLRNLQSSTNSLVRHLRSSMRATRLNPEMQHWNFSISITCVSLTKKIGMCPR